MGEAMGEESGVDDKEVFDHIPAGIDLLAAADLEAGTARRLDVEMPIEGQPRTVSLILVRKDDGALRVYGNRCSHFGVPLDAFVGYGFLAENNTVLRCQHHYADFDVDDGRGLSRDCGGKGLPVVTVEVRDGRIITVD